MRHAVHTRLSGSGTPVPSGSGLNRHWQHHDCLGAGLPADRGNGVLLSGQRAAFAQTSDQDYCFGPESLVRREVLGYC